MDREKIYYFAETKKRRHAPLGGREKYQNFGGRISEHVFMRE